MGIREKIREMKESGMTISDIAARMTLSESMVRKYLQGALGSGLGDTVREMAARGMTGYAIAMELGENESLVYYHLRNSEKKREMYKRVGSELEMSIGDWVRLMGLDAAALRRAAKSGRMYGGYKYQKI